MRHVQVLYLTVVLVCLPSIAIEAQTDSLASGMIEAFRAKEPGWTYANAIESSHIPLVPSERRVLVGVLRKNESQIRQNVPIWIYHVESPAEGVKWLARVRAKQVAPGWEVNAYRLGDEAYLLTLENGKRFEIDFRSGNIVGRISGDDLANVKAFAQDAVDQVSTK